jgi:hypothetical protein
LGTEERKKIIRRRITGLVGNTDRRWAVGGKEKEQCEENRGCRVVLVVEKLVREK